ncbi:hypothetical protein GBAR_LOCUS9344 [Geodia barretti]|uniref:Uncharacterized protein n=1 Tax=Geodia barretti TaxID=519541 RepID=A0AA35RQZ3_GEOBA|nr:hypothetical protein GBAR_LOCUS9344 [Geodia barretti]
MWYEVELSYCKTLYMEEERNGVGWDQETHDLLCDHHLSLYI